MDTNRKFLFALLPIIGSFDYFKIYTHELNTIKEEIAKSVGKKNIYEALDLPDFRYVLNSKITIHVICLLISKLKLFDNYKVDRRSRVLTTNNDGERYQIIYFKYGSLPKVKVSEKNLLFFMYELDYKKVYYCGLHTIEENQSGLDLENFYNYDCVDGTNYFVNFKALKR